MLSIYSLRLLGIAGLFSVLGVASLSATYTTPTPFTFENAEWSGGIQQNLSSGSLLG